MRRRYTIILRLLLCMTLASCAGPMTPPDDEPNGNMDSNLNEGEVQELDDLRVSLGTDQVAGPDEFVEIEAAVENPDGGALYYLWQYVLDGQDGPDEAHVIAATADHFVLDWQMISFRPQELFPDVDLDGRIIRIAAHVREEGEYQRQGSASKRLFIMGRGIEPGDDHGDANDNSDDNETGNENDNNENDDNDGNENDNQNENDNDNSNDNTGPVSPPGGNVQPPSDPCDAFQTFTVLFPSSLSMSMYQGSVRLSPTVCKGTAPYTYDWSPTTYLQEPDDGLGGPPSGVVDDADVDFKPLATGTYAVTVEVTDDVGHSEQRTVTINVNSYTPLQSNAGADQAVVQGAALDLTGSALGGSGSYSYTWSPSGPSSATFTGVPTSILGEKTYTLKVTDNVTGQTASDTVRVVVKAAGGSCTDDDDLGVDSAAFVGFDSNYGTAGQAVAVSGAWVILFDLDTDTIRATLPLPATGRGLAIDATRGRAFVTTQLAGQFTRSVQVIDLDGAALGDNITLTANVIDARGMAVVPATGEVLVAVSGASTYDGLMVIDPDSSTLNGALQNMHHSDSFQQPIAVAYLDQGGLSVAAVANAGSPYVTLVPWSAMTFTADDPTGGGQATLARIAVDSAPRALVADPANARLLAGWNNGLSGIVRVVSVSANQSGSAGSSIVLSGALIDQGLAFDTSSGLAFAALGSIGTAVINLTYSVQSATLQGTASTTTSVAAQSGHDKVLIVGLGSDLSERCP